MASLGGRGAQVRLDGEQQRAARGGLAGTLPDNVERKRLLEFAGAVSDGTTPDGSARSGIAAEDEVLAPSGVLLGTVEQVNDAISGFAVTLSTLGGRVGGVEMQTAAIAPLSGRVAAVEAQGPSLQALVAGQASTIIALQGRIEVLEARLAVVVGTPPTGTDFPTYLEGSAAVFLDGTAVTFLTAATPFPVAMLDGSTSSMLDGSPTTFLN